MADVIPIERDDTGSPPLVGRESELRALGEGIADARRGRGSLFLIAGEAGIGKTRLADAFAGLARGSGAMVAWGRAWEDRGAPAFWPWSQVERSLLRELGGSVTNTLTPSQAVELARIVPELVDTRASDSPPSGDTDAARFELFGAVASTLVAAASERPLVIVLDDLHAADEPSLLLLRYVGAAIEDAPIVVLGVFRDDELELDESRTSLLGQLGRLPISRSVRPRALGAEDVARLVAGLGTEVSPEAATMIQRETEGNPLFVAELARMLAEEDRVPDLAVTHDRSPGLSAGVRAVIGRRLARLPDETRSLLTHSSVLGKEFSVDAVAQLEGESVATLIRRFDPAVRSRVIVQPHPGGTWRFGHALIREVLYADIPMSDRIALHQAAGKAIETLHIRDRENHLSELAHHFAEAAPLSGPDTAIDYARRAAEKATVVHAHEEAARLYGTALRVQATFGSTSDRTRVGLLLALGSAEASSGRAAASKAAYQAAATAAISLGLSAEFAQAAIGYGGRFVWARAGDDPHLVPLLMEALRRLPDEDGADRVRILSRLSGALRDEISMEPRVAYSAEAVAMARRIGDPSLLAYALIGRYGAIMGPDHADEMTAIRLELVELEGSSDDLRIRSQAPWMALMRFIEGGTDRRALRMVDESYGRLVHELRDPAMRWSLGVFRTIVALNDGRLADAEALIAQTHAIGKQAQPWDADFAALVATVALRREQDRLPEVLDALRDAIPRYPSYPLLRCLLTFVQAVTDHDDEARRSLGVLLGTESETLPRDLGWTYGMVQLAEAAIALGDHHAAARIEARLAPFAALHASASGEVSAGPVSLTLARLAAFDGRHDEALAYADTAAGWVADTGAGLWAVRLQVERAAALLGRGGVEDRQAAAALLDEGLGQCRVLGLRSLERRIGELLGEGIPAEAARSAITVGRSLHGSWQRDGEYWSIRFGPREFRLADSRGVGYLATLLSMPGREVHALELVQGPGRLSERAASASRGAVGDGLRPDAGRGDIALDAQAVEAYRVRIEDLQDQIEEAERFADLERAARARDERDFIVAELGRGLGLGGRARRSVSDGERARQSVTKAIHAALRRIRDWDPELADHLDRSVRTGIFCTYDPDPGLRIAWRVTSGRVVS